MDLISPLFHYFNTPASIWMGVGALVIVIEVLTIPGVGFIFAGLGALTTGLALQFGFIDDHALTTQFMLWFATTIGWAGILWKPLRGKNKKAPPFEYSNIVGDHAVVAFKQLDKGITGRVKWSGTVMQARLAEEDHHPSIPEGAEVEIIAAEGNILIVKHLKR